LLYDIQFSHDGVHRPGFFEAAVTRGILHCDTEAPGPNGEPPVKVLGWERKELQS
jgi:hypothetical protein